MAALLLVLTIIAGFLLSRSLTRKIRSPRLGFLNLKGASAAEALAADRRMLSPIFNSTEEGFGAPPRCDVLFVCCDIERDGRIVGVEAGLRDLIREAGARVVVVASENDGTGCISSTRTASHGRANLVLTLDRKGPVFTLFFTRLFGEMMNGVSMPRAWVKLAPQIPGHEHGDCPDAIFLAGSGQLAFK